MSVTIMHSGRRLDSAAPDIAAIRLHDIGAHLAKTPVLKGATRVFYSEAQHACLIGDQMARQDGPAAALYGLLHNAHLAVDTNSDAERRGVAAAIFASIDLDWPVPETFHRALLTINARVVLTEIRQLVNGGEIHAATIEREGVAPLKFLIRPWPWDRALDRFIASVAGYAVAADLRPTPALEGIL